MTQAPFVMTSSGLALPLISERLVLRRLTAADHEAVWRYASDPAVTRFTAFACHQRREDTDAFLRNIAAAYEAGHIGALALVERQSDTMIGTIGITLQEVNKIAELGWALQQASWGLGYASEGLRTLIAGLFQTEQVDEVCAHAALANPASLRVMEKAGMRRVNVSLAPRLLRGRLEEIAGYVLRREEWIASPRSK